MTPPPAKPRWYRTLHGQIALGIGLGFLYAMVVRTLWPFGPETAELWAQLSAPFVFLGSLFIRALKMIIIPLVVASVVVGVTSMGDAKELGRTGAKTLVYYVATTFLAVVLGMVIVNLFEPGKGLALDYAMGKEVTPTPLLTVFEEIIPPNVLEAFAGNKMLPSIFVALLIGLGLLVLGKEAAPLTRLFESGNALVLKITDWIMATAPVGVGALFVQTLLDPNLADVGQFLSDLGVYMLSVLTGLGLHSLLVLPLLLWLFAKRNPLEFLRAMSPALLTAFSTASSSATYPVTLDCVTDGAGVSKKSANFVLPLGATINMDGTALYEAVAVVFIANALGIELDFAQQVTVVVTATLAAIGAAGVPSAGLVTMVIVLESVGLPGTAYGLVVAVDRVLDMCRTTVNVWGDSVGAAIVDRWSEVQGSQGDGT